MSMCCGFPSTFHRAVSTRVYDRGKKVCTEKEGEEVEVTGRKEFEVEQTS